MSSEDKHTKSDIPHRKLQIEDVNQQAIAPHLCSALISHHGSDEMHSRIRKQQTALEKIGYQRRTRSRFPVNSNTRKGNLAEYLTSGTEIALSVYR